MGNALSKIGHSGIYWDEKGPQKNINNNLTPLQAINIINRLSLFCENKELLEEVEELKQFIKNR